MASQLCSPLSQDTRLILAANSQGHIKVGNTPQCSVMSRSKFSLVWPSTAGARDEQLMVTGDNFVSNHIFILGQYCLLHECINNVIGFFF